MMIATDNTLGCGLGARLAHDAMIDEMRRYRVSYQFVVLAWREGISVRQRIERYFAEGRWV